MSFGDRHSALSANKYRLETEINYTVGVVLIKRMGTHGEYSKWDL